MRKTPKWEFDYDQDGTEDYYITLDLSTNIAPKSRLNFRGLDTEGSEAPSSSSLTPWIQILDLHTDSPLLMVDGVLYSCKWATAVGTDLLMSNIANAVPSDSDNALRTTPRYHLQAATPLRLVAKPSTVKRRRLHDTEPETDLYNNPRVATNGREDDDARMPEVVVAANAAENPAPGAAFLARLASIKRLRSETDTVNQATPRFAANGRDYVADAVHAVDDGHSNGLRGMGGLTTEQRSRAKLPSESRGKGQVYAPSRLASRKFKRLSTEASEVGSGQQWRVENPGAEYREVVD